MKKLRLALPGAVAAALVVTSAAAAFTPANTYYGKQWYLAQDRAFDAWPAPPPFDSVKVAIVDSGVECSLPDFQGRIALTKSFVGGSPCIDTEGHGTIVAGEIAGDLDSAGVVGLAFSSQLLVAKVVAPDGSIPLKAEAAGIVWAVKHGAQVVNLSFGAVRDPLDRKLDAYSKAEDAALKALHLDSNLAEGHLALGKVYFWKIDLAASLREYQRATELKPNDAGAHHWLGNDALAALGRFEEAIAEVKRAVELDPLSPVINTDLGTTFYYAHRYDESARQLRKTLEIDPTFFYAHFNLGIALQAKGDLSGAISEYEKAKQLSDNTFVSTLFAQAKAYAGDKDAALRMLSDLDKISQSREVLGYYRALLYLSLNNRDEALHWLEQGLKERDGADISWINVDPLLDSLHGDPRFESLVQKVVGDKK